MLPLFRRLEDYQHGADEVHGAGGEVRVEEIRACAGTSSKPGAKPPPNAASRKIREFNRGDNFGCAYFQMNQRRGRRWSATNAFLRPVLHRPNLTVITNALVERLRFERARHAAERGSRVRARDDGSKFA